jgi:cell division protein FtsN
MKIHNVFIIMLCFFMTACISQFQGSKFESEARDFMIRAAEHENAKAYPQALKEYTEVAKQYPSTSYYKRAVWKAATLNIHPDNPKINDTAASDWFQVYLGLHLSSKEKEAASACLSLLKRIHNLKGELSDINTEKDKIASVAQKQSKEMEADAQRVKELETELAHSWDELQKMKAVDVQMHQSRVDQKTGKPSPLLQMVPESEKGTGKKELPVLSNVPEKAQEFYPYAIQVGSYRDKKDSLREAMILRDKGDSVCVSLARINGKGDWYRVIVGFYRTPGEAQKAALELIKREYRNAFVVRQPFTIEIGIFSGDEKLEEIENQLILTGYSAYTLPIRDDKNKFRLLVGAFHTENEAETVSKNLQKEGLKSKVVRR